jgi:hypothetical protein
VRPHPQRPDQIREIKYQTSSASSIDIAFDHFNGLDIADA